MMNLPTVENPTSVGQPAASPARLAAMPRAGLRDRLIAGLAAAAACSVLALAASLKPAPEGFGTHQQLGLSACNMKVMQGRPCPSCGMTTAFAWFVRGDVAAAMRAQVLGTVLAAGVLLVAIGGLIMAVAGVHFGPVLFRIFVLRIDWLYVLIVLAMASWALKCCPG